MIFYELNELIRIDNGIIVNSSWRQRETHFSNFQTGFWIKPHNSHRSHSGKSRKLKNMDFSKRHQNGQAYTHSNRMNA